MILNPGLHADKQSGFLIGGRSPIYWHRGFARSGAKRDLLERVSAWVEERETACPSLRSGPLLGHCLAILCERGAGRTNEEEVSKPKESQSPLVKRLKGQDWKASRDRRHAERSSGSKTAFIKGKRHHRMHESLSPHRSAPLPIALGRQASRNLLKRSAGDTHLTREIKNHRQKAIRVSLKVKSLPSSHSPSRDPKAHQDWLIEVANRTKRSMRAPWTGLSDMKRKWMSDPEGGKAQRQSVSKLLKRTVKESSESIEGLSASKQSESGQLMNSPVSSLAEQWSIPLNGLPAPEALLETWACPSESLSRGGAGSERRRSYSHAVKGDRLSGHPLKSGSEAVQARPITKTFPTKGLSSEGFGKDLHLSNDMRRKRVLPEGTATPLMTPSLPPLHFPPEAMTPSPSISAANMKKSVGRGKWRTESAGSEADLSLLATNIKRVLDEEARRHGIDI